MGELLNNKEFWNNRYKTNMKLGSGRGSRGQNLKIKEDIVKNIVKEYNVQSVLDIGCGDCEVNKNINFKNYIGADVSDYIIKRNKSLFPNREFLLADFNYIQEKKLTADLVICFDVLIHQPTFEEYKLGVETIKNSFNKVALVSAFDNWKTKGTVYFYESVIKSFDDCNVEVLTNFDIQTLIKITKK